MADRTSKTMVIPLEGPAGELEALLTQFGYHFSIVNSEQIRPVLPGGRAKPLTIEDGMGWVRLSDGKLHVAKHGEYVAEIERLRAAPETKAEPPVTMGALKAVNAVLDDVAGERDNAERALQSCMFLAGKRLRAKSPDAEFWNQIVTFCDQGGVTSIMRGAEKTE